MARRVKMDVSNRAKQFAPFAALKGFEEALREKESPIICNEGQVAVPVIATFNKDGKFDPLYFSLEGIRIKIDKIKWVDDKCLWVYTFRCEITLSDRLETVDLCYYKNLNVWTMKGDGNRE